MAFVLSSDRRFSWPAVAQLPSDDTPGTVVETTFTLIFRAVGDDRLNALDDEWLKATQAGAPAADLFRLQHAGLREVIAGWEGVEDGDGQPVPFGPATLDAAISDRWWRAAAYRAFKEATDAGPRVGN